LHAIEINASLIRSWGVRCGRLRGVWRLTTQSTGLHYNRDKRLIKFLSSLGSWEQSYPLHHSAPTELSVFCLFPPHLHDVWRLKSKTSRWIIINNTRARTYTYIIYYVIGWFFFSYKNTQYIIIFLKNNRFQKRNYPGNYFMCHINLTFMINKIWTPCR